MLLATTWYHSVMPGGTGFAPGSNVCVDVMAGLCWHDSRKFLFEGGGGNYCGGFNVMKHFRHES